MDDKSTEAGVTTTDGVCVGLVRAERMLVVRTRRYPEHWQPIGGRCAEREAPRETAAREILEETGWTVDPHRLHEVLVEPMDAHAGVLTFYITQAPSNEPLVDFEEIAETRWVTKEESLALAAFAAARKFFSLWADT